MIPRFVALPLNLVAADVRRLILFWPREFRASSHRLPLFGLHGRNCSPRDVSAGEAVRMPGFYSNARSN